MKNYRYPQQFRSEHRNYLSLFLSIGLFLIALGTAIADFQSLLEDIRGGVFIFTVALIGIIYDVYQINMYPNVTTSEKGLGIEFLGFKVHISWEDLESLHMIQSAYYPEQFTEWFIKTKKLTPFHLLYGKNKYGNYVTGFLIRSEIESVQELLDEIGGKLPVNKYQPVQKAKYSR